VSGAGASVSDWSVGVSPLFVPLCVWGWDFEWVDGSCDGPGSSWIMVLFELPYLQLFL